MRCDDVLGAANGAHSAVRGEDDDRRDTRLQSAVQVGKTFNVEHVDLVA